MNPMPAMEMQQAFGLRRHALDAVLLLVAAGLAAAAVAVDLLTYRVNLPIVYIVPLLLIEPLDRRRLLWQSAAAFVVLTFGGYFFGHNPPNVDGWQQFVGVRLMNRVLTVLTIVAAAGVLHLHILLRARMRRRHVWPHDPDGRNYFRVVVSIDRVLAPMLAGFITFVLFVCDLVAPAEFNFALLYGLPLFILSRTRSIVVMWLGVQVLVAAALAGLWLGPALEDPAHFPNIMLNRAIVCVTILLAGGLLHARLRAAALAGE